MKRTYRSVRTATAQLSTPGNSVGGSPSGKKDIPCVYVQMKKIVNVENQGFQVVLSDCATQTIPRRRWRRLDVETGVRIIEIEGVEPPL